MIVAWKKWGSIIEHHLGSPWKPVYRFGINSFKPISSFHFSPLFIFPFFSYFLFFISLPFTFWFAFCIHPFSARDIDGCGDGVVWWSVCTMLLSYHSQQSCSERVCMWKLPWAVKQLWKCLYMTHGWIVITDKIWRSRMAPNLCRLV